MVKARGIKDGKKMEVAYNGHQFTFNGELNAKYASQVMYHMRCKHPIGGTYHAKNYDDEINIINVLRRWFFDKQTSDIESDCTFTLPYEEGVIY